ncbi:unnamed protein product [Psylliodes chrysocephalus]|uniref:HAT C-terminal dimerisation domain-containing protein n=1 Tax=Psylliodes chrysocephalus TaxID=3402493 RepID=A0A9P0DDN4_9CUCU|nr:unnamed protein product [Psylliodes chrysocephala]
MFEAVQLEEETNLMLNFSQTSSASLHPPQHRIGLPLPSPSSHGSSTYEQLSTAQSPPQLNYELLRPSSEQSYDIQATSKEPQNILLQKEDISDSLSTCSSFVSTVATTNTKHTQPGIETCLSNIKDYKDGGNKAGKIYNAIFYMLAKDTLPLNTVEKEGFKNLMKVTVPLYKIPGRSKMTNMVDEKYNILSYKMKEIIKNVTNISLSTDVWTDTLNTRSFLGLTCHFIHGNDLKSVSIGVTELNQKNCCCSDRQWHEYKKAVIDAFGKTKHLPCFGHTINLVAAKPFYSSTDIKEFVTQIKDIVRYFKHSVAASDELRKCQDMRQAPLKLIQSVSTRWNSMFYMIERFVNLSELLKNSSAPPMLTASQLETARDLITILKALESITRELSGAKVTVSKVIPKMYCLRKEINSVLTKSPLGEDPRFKKNYFEDKIACSHAVTKIMNTLSEMKDDNAIFEEDEVPDEVDTPGKEAVSLWRHHDTLIKENRPQVHSNDKAADMTFYLNQPLEDLKKTNPIKFWKSQMFVNLRKIAVRYFCSTATSVPSERLFSGAG